VRFQQTFVPVRTVRTVRTCCSRLYEIPFTLKKMTIYLVNRNIPSPVSLKLIRGPQDDGEVKRSSAELTFCCKEGCTTAYPCDRV